MKIRWTITSQNQLQVNVLIGTLEIFTFIRQKNSMKIYCFTRERNSVLVFGSSLNTPNIELVTVLLFIF